VSSLLPKAFLSSLEGLPGYDAAAFDAVHADGKPVTSIRINPAKAGNAFPSEAMPVPWSSWGYYLKERPYFTFDPLFHAGAYYVQEASGMFLEQALRQTADIARPLRVLDLCAAPGGKSTLLQSVLSSGSLLVSNEVIRNRVGVLEENMVKWGAVGRVVTSNDPRDLSKLENYFDVIVVDAPCSGSGLFRRDPETIREWSPGHVQLCSGRQQRILSEVWPALRREGILLYSTCSYSREEDEDILDWVATGLDATSCRLQLAPEWNIVETKGEQQTWGYRFYPDRLQGEGFFIGALRKNGGGDYRPPRRSALPEHPGKKEQEMLRSWIRPEMSLFCFRHGTQLHVLPETLAPELPILQSACYLKRAGVTLGSPSAKEFIPDHDLAMSTVIHPDLPAIPLTHEQALYYLRKEEVRLETSHRGWSLVQYEGHNLGWVKVLSNRWNNYYPTTWRILKRAL
jgi:16S rRNA C967 or C1407 C5-methylase (RsmB/RsmF family)/NOL1/NOP2/fmu family ribosome biogenesis protein